MSTTTPLSTSGSWFVCLFFFFFFGSKDKIAEETILAMGFADVCLFFFSFFLFFFLVVVGLISVSVVGFVTNVVVVGIAMMVEVVIDIDGGGFDECGYGWICD